ncbi:hypothetical protein [Brassicibacter mesophilus]|uniref:hypothetical protein n=1 Tax=Brassicibacter mesophilus TaxID=745119 RepID=UPI003D19F07D
MKSKKLIITLSILVLSISLSAGFVFADSNDQTNSTPIRYGWNLGFGRDNVIDEKNAYNITEDDLVTITGTVSDLNTTDMPYNMKIKDSDDNITDVHLGQIVSYDTFKELELKEGSNVEVTGIERTFKIDNENVSVLAPFTIKSGDKEVKLRDENNRPIWSGQNGQGQGKGMRNGRGQGRGMGRQMGNGLNQANCPFLNQQ